MPAATLQWHVSGWDAAAAADRAVRLTRPIGWLSIGLGLAELLAPAALGRLIGVGEPAKVLLRALAMRELASGAGIFAQPGVAGWLWSRVGGDVMDLALLGLALRSPGTVKRRVSAALAAVAGILAVDVLCGRALDRSEDEWIAGTLAAGTGRASPWTYGGGR